MGIIGQRVVVNLVAISLITISLPCHATYCFSDFARSTAMVGTGRLYAAKKKAKKQYSAAPTSSVGAGFGTKPTERPTKDEKVIKKVEKTQPLTERIGHSSSGLTDEEELFTTEYHRLKTKMLQPISKRLVQVSTSPLLFTIDDFIDPVQCEQVKSDGSGCFDLLFPERVADLLFQGQESELDGLLFTSVSSKDHHDPYVAYPDGIHMDTNGQVLFRHVTCILYLNTVPEDCGGATVFPLARTTAEDSALAGARLLLSEKISHTRSPVLESIPGGLAAARSIEARWGANYLENPKVETAIRIQPKAGRLLIFFSRDETGAEDPRSWHAGERIKSTRDEVVEKRILTLFKQVDYSKPCQIQTTFETYLSPQIQKQQQWLKVKAQSGIPIDYGVAS